MEHNYYTFIDGWFDFDGLYDHALEKVESGIFVEIGTWKGRSIMYLAEKIKESGKEIKLFGIDTFEGSESSPAMGDIQEMKKMSKDHLYNLYLKNIEPLKDYIHTIRGNSKLVHDQFEDESIDFLFIDGDHSYESIKQDIFLWYPKVKIGGIISGHDYVDGLGYGVIQAVKECFSDRDYKVWPPYAWHLIKTDNKNIYQVSIHPKGYWLEIDGPNTHTFDEKLCNAIADIFTDQNIKTAYDIGCGDGRYTRHLIKRGIDCKGWDGSPKTPEISQGLCGVKDFSDPQDLTPVDLVMSLEVGEHIPKRWEHIFIDNLCRASKRFICLSWAIEGQPGYGHFNCQNNDYVIEQFKQKGFEYCPASSKFLRENCSKDTFPWFVNTLLIFKRA